MTTSEQLYREWLDASSRYGNALRQAEELILRRAAVPAGLLDELQRLETDVKLKLEVFACGAEGHDWPH